MRHPLAVLLIAALAHRCGAVEPVPIPNVSSLEQLSALEPVKLKDWTLKLGLGDSGRDGGPWVLLYCLAEYTGKPGAAEMRLGRDFHGERLGPVFWSLRPEGERLKQLAVAAQKVSKRQLYAAVVPVAWKGEYPLRVLGPDGQTIARTELVIQQPRPCYWHTLAERRPRADAGGAAVRYGVARESVAAIPKLPEFESVLPEAGWEVSTQRLQKGQNLLPGAVPLHPIWAKTYGGKAEQVKDGEAYTPLELSFDGKAFVVGARDRKIFDAGERQLLARWWVNGRPVEARPREEAQKLQQAEQVLRSNRFETKFALPAALGELKEGDKVALQVMYVQERYDELEDPRIARQLMHEMQAVRDKPLPVPVLSNQIEWEMRKDLIERAARP